MSKEKTIEMQIDMYKRLLRDARELLGLDWKTIREHIDVCPACGSDIKKKG